MATIATVHWLAVGTRAMVSDEVIYLLQGKWIFQRDYAWHLDPDLLPFFSMRKLGVTPSGGLYGQYTPGWPALLALFDLIGLRWWSGAILGTASVWATVRLGTLLYSRSAGLIAGALLLIQPTFLLLHAGYMAHPATILSLAMAAAGQAARQSLHGQGHAVDLRRPGFGDEGVAHARQLRVLPSLCVRDAIAMTPA